MNRQMWRGLSVWGLFIVLNIIINGTIPFVLGADLHDWTYSITKNILFSVLLYYGVFLVIPLILTKGWQTVRQPVSLVALAIILLGVTLWGFNIRYGADVVVPILVYLHWRYDLSDLGFRSHGIKGDIVAVLVLGLLPFVLIFFGAWPPSFTPGKALSAGLDRLFANPASTLEYLFYFGFLAERLSHKAGRGVTSLLIALMYTFHEMSNPEYWYEGMSITFTFIGMALLTMIYLWRRNIVAIWLGDGWSRFVLRLF